MPDLAEPMQDDNNFIQTDTDIEKCLGFFLLMKVTSISHSKDIGV
jgi:hypothetical protein